MVQVMKNTLIILTFLFAVPHEAVTVNPALCPTNKIAPHKKITSWNRSSSRTFAAFHDLLTPNTPQGNGQEPLQEQPQEDQPDDCGEIDDYDENDLSSLSQQVRRRQDRTDNRFFFGGLFHKPPQQAPPPQAPPQQYPPQQYPPQYPQATTTKPLTRPPKPSYPPMRPPYWSGGVFSNNQFQPPPHEDPSDNYKPVHESHFSETSQTYWPGLVGGPSGHVVGVTLLTTTPIPDENTRRRTSYRPNNRYFTQATVYPTRRPRPRKLNDDTVIGSFIDLFFK